MSPRLFLLVLLVPTIIYALIPISDYDAITKLWLTTQLVWTLLIFYLDLKLSKNENQKEN